MEAIDTLYYGEVPVGYVTYNYDSQTVKVESNTYGMYNIGMTLPGDYIWTSSTNKRWYGSVCTKGTELYFTLQMNEYGRIEVVDVVTKGNCEWRIID